MRRFRNRAVPTILVTTQVCEMSLDLDADLLISEIAPVPSLIQRMGRCCREPIPKNDRLGEVCFYRPIADLPYQREEIDDGEAFAREMENQRRLTHVALADYLKRWAVRKPFIPGRFTSFVDSGGYAMAREDPFREDDEHTVDAVLDCDLEAFQRARDNREPEAEGFVVPVPQRFASRSDILGDWPRQAPAAHYDRWFGFQNEEVRSRG
jgi:CRISPR-associated endonuclease/helicase Cas3